MPRVSSFTYTIDSSHLPAPLPSLSAIHASKELLLSHGNSKRVVVVDEHFVVKYGTLVDPVEGETMLFVRQKLPSVRVPQVYAVFEEDEKAYIIMERVRGEVLSCVWNSLLFSEKWSICLKLSEILATLRSVPSPGYYGCIGKRPFTSGVFYTGDDDTSAQGPFVTEDEVNEAMVKKLIWCLSTEFNVDPRFRAGMYRDILPHVFKNHPPVFTHGDIQPKNLILTRNATSRAIELTLIDWELAGFYPSYWEYSMTMHACVKWDSDWGLWMNSTMDQYVVEWPYLQMIHRDGLC